MECVLLMDKTIVLKLKCPKCGCPARAKVKKQLYKFLIYVCPYCDSNVVYYDNRIDVLSDKFIESMAEKSKFKFSGAPIFPKRLKKLPKKTSGKEITDDDILDLQILLNTELDFDSLISKL